MEIDRATLDFDTNNPAVGGNDGRTIIVAYAHHPCTMWDGPSLVTTPNSDFATLCSFLLEAVSGQPEESLAGAISRYARSSSRKDWDDDAQYDEDDNFISKKNTMRSSANKIRLYRVLLQREKFSERAKELLEMMLGTQSWKFKEARDSYGPNQVYPSRLNERQWDDLLLDAVKRLKPEQLIELDDNFKSGKSEAERDVALGKQRRQEKRES